MSASPTQYPDYYNESAKQLRRHLRSTNPTTRGGALERIRRHLPETASIPDPILCESFQHGDALTVIARSERTNDWRAFRAGRASQVANPDLLEALRRLIGQVEAMSDSRIAFGARGALVDPYGVETDHLDNLLSPFRKAAGLPASEATRQVDQQQIVRCGNCGFRGDADECHRAGDGFLVCPDCGSAEEVAACPSAALPSFDLHIQSVLAILDGHGIVDESDPAQANFTVPAASTIGDLLDLLEQLDGAGIIFTDERLILEFYGVPCVEDAETGAETFDRSTRIQLDKPAESDRVVFQPVPRPDEDMVTDVNGAEYPSFSVWRSYDRVETLFPDHAVLRTHLSNIEGPVFED